MDFSFENISFYMILILPGLVSLKVFNLIVPIKRRSTSENLLDGLFYSSLNAIILIPFYFFILGLEFKYGLVVLYCLMLLISFLSPFIVYSFWIKKSISKKLLLPFPTPWDYFFNKREPCFILIHLKSGHKIGGFYGENSYANAFPDNGDIYLETTYSVTKNGEFGKPIPDSKGLIVTRDEYVFIELFNIPKQKSHE
ncbi:MAG: DUF6338 family protein [Balneola sp.]|jgi:hypothetical protein